MTQASQEPFEMHGELPKLEGLSCEAMYCQSFVANGALVDNANVTYARFAGKWHRLAIDFPAFFWRVTDQETPGFAVETEGWNYPLADVGAEAEVVGQQLLALVVSSSAESATVEFAFPGGRTVRIRGTLEGTNYSVI